MFKWWRETTYLGLLEKTCQVFSLCFGTFLLFSCWVMFDSAASQTAARQALLSSTISWNFLRFISIESGVLSNHLILCYPLLLLPSVFPNIRVYLMCQLFTSGGQSIGASTSSSILPMNVQGEFHLGLASLISMWFKGLSRVFSNTTVQKHLFFSAQPFYGPTLPSIHD